VYASGVSGAKRKSPSRKAKAPAKRAARRAKPTTKTNKAPVLENKATVVEKLIGKVEQKLVDSNEVKATVGDYIRLVQLHKELQEEEPVDIEVRWVDPQKQEEDPNGET
jgi:hypothetical protein